MLDVEVEAVEVHSHIHRAQGRSRLEPIGERGGFPRHEQMRAVLIIEVDDGELGRRSARTLEEGRLGLEVGIHGAVKVEVIAREVSEDDGVKLKPVDASQRERV